VTILGAAMQNNKFIYYSIQYSEDFVKSKQHYFVKQLKQKDSHAKNYKFFAFFFFCL